MKNNKTELTSRDTEIQDAVDNTIWGMILELNPRDGEKPEPEWDDEVISEIREIVQDFLIKKGLTTELEFYPYISDECEHSFVDANNDGKEVCRFCGDPPPEPFPFDKEAYLQRSTQCPYCHSDNIEGHQFDADESGAQQPVHCLDCGKHWTDIYTLTDVEAT